MSRRDPVHTEQMLSNELAKRRIQAARTLRGISQEDMDAAGARNGLPKYDLGRTERGDLPLTRARALVLAEVLQMPRDWFLEPDLDRLLARGPDRAEVMLEQILNVLRGEMDQDAFLRLVGEAGERDAATDEEAQQ